MVLCNVCHEMLYQEAGIQHQASSLRRKFHHHKHENDLKHSANVIGCQICIAIDHRLSYPANLQLISQERGQSSALLYATIKAIPKQSDLWQLDFRTDHFEKWLPSKPVASFMLIGPRHPGSHGFRDPFPKGTSEVEVSASHVQTRPISSSTDDPKVFTLAKEWIDACKASHDSCVAPSNRWYPTRLLEICSESGKPDSAGTVRLVSRDRNEFIPGQPVFVGEYVTLSHCWGDSSFNKLTDATLRAFQLVISLNDLPRTFIDAIKVARELSVRWIWIDALCIKQGNEDDWSFEASQMHRVYMHSYCNISATAASNSSAGLFSTRDPMQEWSAHATLKVPDRNPSYVPCTVLDLFFWEDCIEQAPVNRRSWVLQERLLAPRVLHWCKNQIAFECRQGDRAECRPPGSPQLQLRQGNLVDEARLKRMDILSGKELRDQRIMKRRGSFHDVSQLRAQIDNVGEIVYYYELWKRVVEQYTKMDLTHAQDRLVALSGIAQMLTREMHNKGIQDRCIAGLWLKGFASQLLWHVNEGQGKDPQPLKDVRPCSYRAPTWSWASIETARGVTFGEMTDEQLCITVESGQLTYRKQNDMLGLLDDGYIVLRGVLRRAIVSDSRARPTESTKTQVSQPESPSKLVVTKRATKPQLIRASRSCLKRLATVYALVAGCVAVWQSVVAGYSISLTTVMNWVSLALVAWPFYYQSSTEQHGSGKDTVATNCFTKSNIAVIDLADAAAPAPVSEAAPADDETYNRYSWRLTKDGTPAGPSYSVMYLDSPASKPSIFGPDGHIFVLPALLDRTRLTCLILQMTDGDYGVRYRRVGLTKILRLYDDQVSAILRRPGHHDVECRTYAWGPQTKMFGGSTICII